MLPRWALGSSSTPMVPLGSSRGPRWSGKSGPWPQTPGRAWARPSSHGFPSDQYVPRELLWPLLFCCECECECDDDSLPLELFAAWLACLCVFFFDFIRRF